MNYPTPQTKKGTPLTATINYLPERDGTMWLNQGECRFNEAGTNTYNVVYPNGKITSHNYSHKSFAILDANEEYPELSALKVPVNITIEDNQGHSDVSIGKTYKIKSIVRDALYGMYAVLEIDETREVNWFCGNNGRYKLFKVSK